MNAKSLIPLVAGLGIAGLAAKLGLDFIRKAEGKQAKVVQLWTPTQDIKRGVAIDETMLQPLEYPEKLTPPGALSDREKIVGRVPHTGAPAGLPILDSMLLPPGAHAGVRVPPGLRAVAVRVDESSGVDNHLEPGCHVDVVGMFTLRGRGQNTIARTILEDVEVAAVGQRLAPSTPNPGEEGSKKSSKPEPARAVTLLVRPEQVPTLHLAEQRGKIKLCMRGTTDGGQSTRNVRVEEEDLLGSGKAKPEPQRELTWSEKIAEFVGALGKNGEPQPKPEEPPAAKAPLNPLEPQCYWMMVVQNGDERRMLRWQHAGDFQPTEINSSGGQNIFEDPPEYPPPTPPTIGSQARGPGSQPEPDGVPGDAEETESEPEELFE